MRMLLLLGVVTWHVTNSNAMAVAPTLEALDHVTRSLNTFGDKFFKAVAEDTTGNLIISPISASMVLSMATWGAKGQTEQQLRSALSLPADDAVTKTGIQALVESFANFKEVDLRLANKIYLAQGFTPKPEFMGITEISYGSKAQTVDFRNAEEASKTINDWCEAQTNNRIKDLIQPNDLSSDTAVVLVNAVYFKGNWATKFDAELTKPRPFHVDENTVKDVPTMFQSGSFRYGELPQVKAKFVELPYKSKDYSDAVSMFIILPDEQNGLKEMEQNLDKITVPELLRGVQRDVNVMLPKFKIESTVDLKEPLTKLGLTDMFTSEANFTGIVDSPPLKVSKVVQKAFIEVNEEGSEAAAATGMIAMAMSIPPPPVHFAVDRAFICVIAAKQSRQQASVPMHPENASILFMAKVTDPTSG